MCIRDRAGEDEMSADWVRYLTTIMSWNTDLDARMPGGESGREALELSLIHI